MLTNFLDHKLGKKYNTFDLLVLFLIIAMTLMLRLWFIDLQFPDYTICLKPWVEQFRSCGAEIQYRKLHARLYASSDADLLF